MAKVKYDYIKVRVSEGERAVLESTVEAGRASTLSDAARKLAFGQKANSDLTESMTQYLQELAGIREDFRKLVYAQLENETLYEPDLVRMEREISSLSKSVAKMAKAIRKGL